MRALILLALCLLSACTEFHEHYEVRYEVDETTFAAPCEDFCSTVVIPEDDEPVSCETLQAEAGNYVFCTFTEPGKPPSGF